MSILIKRFGWHLKLCMSIPEDIRRKTAKVNQGNRSSNYSKWWLVLSDEICLSYPSALGDDFHPSHKTGDSTFRRNSPVEQGRSTDSSCRSIKATGTLHFTMGGSTPLSTSSASQFGKVEGRPARTGISWSGSAVRPHVVGSGAWGARRSSHRSLERTSRPSRSRSLQRVDAKIWTSAPRRWITDFRSPSGGQAGTMCPRGDIPEGTGQFARLDQAP